MAIYLRLRPWDSRVRVASAGQSAALAEKKIMMKKKLRMKLFSGVYEEEREHLSVPWWW